MEGRKGYANLSNIKDERSEEDLPERQSHYRVSDAGTLENATPGVALFAPRSLCSLNARNDSEKRRRPDAFGNKR